jgi:hypothetical protein
MMKKLLLCLPTVALVSAFAASSYRVTLFDESTVAGKTLKPGDYKLEVNDGGIVLKRDKDVTEAAAKTETADKKYKATTIRYDDKHQIREICIGGTNKKLVLTGDQSQAKGEL